MAWLRVTWRLFALVGIQVLGLITGLFLHVAFSGNRPRHWKCLTWAIHYWGWLNCRALNFRIQMVGEKSITSPALIVSNHIGTADIFVLAHCAPAFFVSRLDVGQWPLVGKVTQLGATVYIDRSRRSGVAGMVDEIRQRFDKGCSVALFPEGRATDGRDVLPFKSSAFESAALSGRPVQPLMIQYHDDKTPSAACWTGNNFLSHIVDLMKVPRLEITVHVLPPLKGTDRHVLAAESHDLVRAKFQEVTSE